MKIFKNILTCVLAVALLLTAGACAMGNGTTADNVFDFSKDGYSIVRPADASWGARLSGRLLSALRDAFGVSPDCIDDTASVEGANIVIGQADRSSVTNALAILESKGSMSDNDYIICKSEGDIVIVGTTDEATESAVEYFIETKMYASSIEEETVYVDAPKAASNSVTIGGTNIGSFSIITPLYNHSYVVDLQVQSLISTVKSNTNKNISEKKDSSVASLPSSLETHDETNQPSEDEYNAYKSTFNGLNKTISRANTSNYEIIVGNCNRDGVTAITNPDTYEIRIVGTKVYLNGGSPRATAMAVSEFAKMVGNGAASLTNSNSVTGDYYDALPNYNKSSYYTLTWGDDFNGAKINEGNWHISYDDENGSTGLNGRKAYRASKELKNNYVKDGKVYLEAKYTDDAYYGGMLLTKDNMNYKYGYVESSSLLPHGQGFWSALWLSSGAGANDLAYTEIDVNESYGPSHYVLGNTFAWLTTNGKNLYTSNYGGSRNHYHVRTNRYGDARGFSMELHTFGYEWDENTVKFICDGEVYKTMNYTTKGFGEVEKPTWGWWFDSSASEDADAELEYTADAFHQVAYLRLGLAVGFSDRNYVMADGASEWTNSNKYITDYIHIYQYEGKDNDEMYIYTSGYQKGDINKDGEVDVLDSIDMARYLATWNRYDFSNFDLGAGDLNGDGVVTDPDLLLLNNYLAGNGGTFGDDSIPEEDFEEDEWEDWVG